MKESSKSFVHVSIAVASWSTMASAFKIGLRHYSYYELLLVAALSALVILSIVISFQKKWYLLNSINAKSGFSLH